MNVKLEELTDKQEAVLEYIVKQIRLKGYPPTVREIGYELGMASSSTVHRQIAHLERKGYVRKNRDKSRAIEVLNDGGLLARQGKGIPIPLVKGLVEGRQVFESIMEYLVMPEQMNIKEEDQLFLFKASETVISLGVIKDDYVLARQQQVVSKNRLVVVLNKNNEPTVRRFECVSNGVRLYYSDEQFEDKNDCFIFGEVLAIHRVF